MRLSSPCRRGVMIRSRTKTLRLNRCSRRSFYQAIHLLPHVGALKAERNGLEAVIGHGEGQTLWRKKRPGAGKRFVLQGKGAGVRICRGTGVMNGTRRVYSIYASSACHTFLFLFLVQPILSREQRHRQRDRVISDPRGRAFGCARPDHHGIPLACGRSRTQQ